MDSRLTNLNRIIDHLDILDIILHKSSKFYSLKLFFFRICDISQYLKVLIFWKNNLKFQLNYYQFFLHLCVFVFDMKNFDFLQKKYNVKIKGNGETTLLLAHGYGCNQDMWRYLTPYLEKHFTLLLFDYIGSGQSDVSYYSPEKYNSLNGYAEDVLEICELSGLGKIEFLGHSVSCTIGMIAAHMRPEYFSHLLLVCPSPCFLKDGDYNGGFEQSEIDELIHSLDRNFLGWASSITPVITGNPRRPEFSDELTQSFCSIRPEIAKQFARITFLNDCRDLLEKVVTPTLIIQTNPDSLVPVEVGKYMHQKIPNSSYTELAVPGHCPHMLYPQHVYNAIMEYLNE